MEAYNFKFDPKGCNSIYFTELLILLNKVNPFDEDFMQPDKKEFDEIKLECKSKFMTCKPDIFFFENKTQIILGRYADTMGCFYNCESHYLPMVLNNYSIFKNDVFIRYIIDKPNIYSKDGIKLQLEHVFPIRIILSESSIPKHAMSNLSEIEEYTYDYFKSEYGISEVNLELINNLPKASSLLKLITSKYPETSVIAREMCVLYYMQFYFYVVLEDDGSYKPFILISKYSIKSLKKLYKSLSIPFPALQLLWNKHL